MQKVRKGEEVNALNLKQFLLEHQLIHDVNSELKIRQFTNGFSNLTYQLDIENKSLVLRRPPVGAVKRGHDMSREFKVLSRLNQGFTKVPNVYAYTDNTAVIGTPFYIMEKVEGIILSAAEAKSRQVASSDFQTIADKWLDTFVELHDLDYKTLGLEDLGRPEGYVERQVTNWAKQYLKAKTDDIDSADAVMQWLRDNQPKTYEHRLIHNDYKYDNVVFANDSWDDLTAVLDWEMCTLGDPLMDLGTSLAYWSIASDHEMILQGLPSPTAMLGNPSRSELVELYAQKSGRNIDHLIFYYAFGLFKLAVIVQQIYYRYHKGLTTDPRFAKLNEATRLFMTMAFMAIKKNRIENLF
jgi:aminoglycoside phosphotransferase (APT) family kinase protein